MESLRKSAAPAPAAPDTERRRAFVLAASAETRAAWVAAAVRHPAIALAGHTRGLAAARRRLEATLPDLVLVDGELLGNDVRGELRRTLAPWRPGLVVIGRGPGQACAAFELGARAFLPPPRSAADLERALSELAGRIAPRQFLREAVRNVLARRLSRHRLAAASPRTLLVRERNRLVPVPVDSLFWIRGAGNYVTLRWPAGELPLRATLAELEQRLDPALFVRIHRSWIVPVERIVRLLSRARGGFVARLEDDTHVVVSEPYRDRLLAALRRAAPERAARNGG